MPTLRTLEPKQWFSENLDEHMALIQRQVDRSIRGGETRQLAVKIVSGAYDRARDPRTGDEINVVKAFGHKFRAPESGIGIAMKDEKREMVAIWDFCVLNFRYVYDPPNIDTFATAEKTLEAGGGDCFTEGTLLLRDDYTLVPVEALQVGDRIWGHQDWTTVEAVAPKGVKAVSIVRLNNGSEVPLTGSHKLWTPEGRVRVSEVEAKTKLLQPTKITFGERDMDPKRAFIEGLYLADGWVDGKVKDAPCRFAISGRDGKPKEEQKKLVQALCTELGVKTRWHARYIAINDATWATRLGRMGGHATRKHLLELDFNEAGIEAIVRGMMADAGRNTHGAGFTWSSTSRTLAIQFRLLMRMLGRSTSMRTVVNHGGLGPNPIYRVGIPQPARADGKTPKQLAVRAVDHDVFEAPTWDIQTSDHHVYLPEYDVTVSNCDDGSILLGALLKSIGFFCKARVISTYDAPEEWVHVYALCGMPKDNPRKWIPLDPTFEGATPGWQYGDIAKYVDYDL